MRGDFLRQIHRIRVPDSPRRADRRVSQSCSARSCPPCPRRSIPTHRQSRPWPPRSRRVINSDQNTFPFIPLMSFIPSPNLIAFAYAGTVPNTRPSPGPAPVVNVAATGYETGHSSEPERNCHELRIRRIRNAVRRCRGGASGRGRAPATSAFRNHGRPWPQTGGRNSFHTPG